MKPPPRHPAQQATDCSRRSSRVCKLIKAKLLGLWAVEPSSSPALVRGGRGRRGDNHPKPNLSLRSSPEFSNYFNKNATNKTNLSAPLQHCVRVKAGVKIGVSEIGVIWRKGTQFFG